MTNRESLPTAEEINVHDSLDERVAVEHFLDKSLDEAEALFRKNALYYQEDLMWMGPRAFCFYIEALANYLRTDGVSDRGDALRGFLTAVRFQLDHYASAIAPSFPLLRDTVRYVIENVNEFNLDPNLDHGLMDEFLAIQERLSLNGRP